MKRGHKVTKRDLLEDLDISLEKALDAKMPDIVGALIRIKASTIGWCDQLDCGECSLAPLQCNYRLEERVAELIELHHAKKALGEPSPASKQQGPPPFKQSHTNKFKMVKKIPPPTSSSPEAVTASSQNIPNTLFTE